MVTSLNISMLSSAFPEPSTTVDSGSSVMVMGSFVSSLKRISRFFSNEPPPVSTMPLSTISAASSGSHS